MIKDPVLFAKMMFEVSKILPKNLDDEDIVSILLAVVASYVPDSDTAEEIMQYTTDSVQDFYERIDIASRHGLTVKKTYTIH
jgi:hypothetical protein|tara:strand:- start:11852 stop:12097 length:246 start_codon:yes stop_codon:yes gene_type:complete